MRNFKFTLIFAPVFIILFLCFYKMPVNVDKINITAIKSDEKYTYITGEIPAFNAYKGYSYESDDSSCYIKIYSTLRLFGGENEFDIRVGKFENTYLTNGKADKKIN